MKDKTKKEKLNPNELREDRVNILRPKIENFIGQDLIKSN